MKKIFAIGDIHGRSDKLQLLLDEVGRQWRPGDVVVFLGDYIDRGSDPMGVIELVSQFKQSHSGTVTLLGNHELMLAGFLKGGCRKDDIYIRNGGKSTLLQVWKEGEDGSLDITARNLQLNKLKKFISDCKLNHVEYAANGEKILFSHAGFNPKKAWDEQSLSDFLWLREEFYENYDGSAGWVVVGHTPVQQLKSQQKDGSVNQKPVLDRSRKIVFCDTGACFPGGHLSCVEMTQKRYFAA